MHLLPSLVLWELMLSQSAFTQVKGKLVEIIAGLTIVIETFCLKKLD